MASVHRKALALGRKKGPYVKLEVLRLSHFGKQGLQQSQEILLVDVTSHVFADDVLDGAHRHGVAI